MRSLLVAILLSSCLTGLSVTSSSGAVAPTHAVSITSPGGLVVTTQPAYASTVDRFAIRSESVVDSLTVTASSTDPGASVRVNGAPVANGAPAAVSGLEVGDEINVQIEDTSGTTNQSWILTPPGFPLLSATGEHPGLEDGLVFLTLASFVGRPYSAIVDAHGVPVRATDDRLSDFKQSGADPERFSAAVPASGGGYRVVELDDQFRETRSHQLSTRPASTDFHDSVMLPDGGAVLMGYDPVMRDGIAYTDAIIEVQDASGTPTLTWNSKDHVDENAEGLVDRSADDYAHINSLQQLDNGDILASFRNLSQVMLIAGSDHDGHQKGDVLWRLGGRTNEFDVVGDPYGGPCAQHAATILDNGRLLIFDNGARRDDTGAIANQTADMCPEAGSPNDPTHARAQSRVTEYVLDTTTTPPTATLVWSHEPSGRYAPFAGNAQRLANGNTMIGWSLSQVSDESIPPIATEVSPGEDAEEIWSLRANGYFSYRAFKFPAPDRDAPEVAISSPSDGVTVVAGTPLPAEFSCSDTGGSNLADCMGTRTHSTDLGTEVGPHTFTVTATDRSGNTSTASVSYTVVAASPVAASPVATPPVTTTSPVERTGAVPDASIRRPGRRWRGQGQVGAPNQTVTLRTRRPRRLVAHVRIANTGDSPSRFVVEGTGTARWARARWSSGQRDVTSRVAAGTYRTSRLSPGSTVRLRLVVRVSDTSRRRTRTVRLTATRAGGAVKDVVKARVKVVRRRS